MSYSNGILSSPSAKGQPGPPGKPGVPGVGYKLTADGNFDIDTKRLTNVAESVDDNDAVSLKVLKEHTQISQNNYHLQPSFKIYKEFGNKSQLTVGTPPNTPSNHFFNNHKAHYDPYIVDKEAYDTGFSGEAWSSMKLKGNQLESGSYTVIFEIFVIGPNNGFLVDDTIIYHVNGDSHYSITTFNSNKINGQYTRSMIQFTTDGGAGADDGIKFQIKYFGSQYNNNIKFLFYSRVIKGSQSTSFDHAIFNVSDVQDNHTILYFNNLNLNGNLINGLSDPVDNSDATNKIYVDVENTKQNIAIADKASKSYVDNQIANVQIDTTPLLPRDGSKTMTGNLNMGLKHILNIENLTDHKVDTDYLDVVKDLKSVVNKEYLNRNFLKIKENYYDLNQRVIKNSAPHDDGSYDNNTLVSKAFVDAEIAKLPKPEINVLKLDGSKAMTGNLNMGMKNILNIDTLNDYTDNSEKDRDLKSVVNKEYLNTHFLKIMGKGDYDFNLGGQIIKNCQPYYDGLFDDNSLVSKAFVDAKISAVDSNTFYKKGEDILVSKQKKITFEVDPHNSLPIDTYVMNMNRYGIEKCGPIKMDDQGNSNLDMSNSSIINIGGIEMKNDNDSELDMKNNKIVNAGKLEMVDDNDSEINMNNNSIINLKDPQPSDASYAASVNFVNTSINHSNTIINGVIDKKIKESEEKSIQTVNQENVFKKVMDDDEFKEDDSDIHKIGVQNKNFHSRNKKTYEFKIDYDPDEGDGEYSARLSIDLIYLPTGSYTMVYEMYIDDGLTVIQIDASSGTLTVGKINSKITGTNTRSIIHFTKNYISSGFDDLDLDIKLKGKTDPKTTIYVVVYGVKGTVNDVDAKIWDRFYYYDGSNLDFEIPIDMNNNKIIGLADGTDDKHAVNKQQVNSLIDKQIKFYYSDYNIKFSKTNVKFNRSGDLSMDIVQGYYLIGYNLPVTTSSDYDSNGGILIKITSTVPDYPLVQEYHNNHLKSNKEYACKTNIYMILHNSELSIKTYGSGIEFQTTQQLIAYIVFYKLFDNLPIFTK